MGKIYELFLNMQKNECANKKMKFGSFELTQKFVLKTETSIYWKFEIFSKILQKNEKKKRINSKNEHERKAKRVSEQNSKIAISNFFKTVQKRLNFFLFLKKFLNSHK